MAEFTINSLDILSYTSSYNITRKNITSEYQMENGNIKNYSIATGFYQIDVTIVCKGSKFAQIEAVIFSGDEKTVNFTYAGTLHTANMLVSNLKANCITLCDEEFWKLTFTLRECRR